MRIEKIAEKLCLSLNLVQKMVIMEHELKYLVQKEELTSLTIDIPDNVMKKLNNISEKLHVSVESIVAAILENEVNKK